MISTGRRPIRSSSAASSPMPTPRSPVSPPDHVFSCDRPRVLALIPSSSDLESQVQTLLDASRVAIDSVNTKGSTVATRLRNIPARVKEVARYGAHKGTARAIAIISTMSGADYRQWELVFPEWGVRREAFEELVKDLYFPTDAIIGDVSLDGVVGNLFRAESD